MKKIKNIVLILVVLVMVFVISSYDKSTSIFHKNDAVQVIENKQNQIANLFVSCGRHCSIKFKGIVEDLKVSVAIGDEFGYFLQNTKISFEIDPNSFNVRSGDDFFARIKTPGLFIGENEEKIVFRSTEIYDMGIDWYQVNGTLSIKGIEKEVILFVTGIRDSKDAKVHSLVLQGQMNLFDWGIDYNKIVGNSNTVPTKWLHINMKIEMS